MTRVRRIDHQLIRCPTFGCQPCKDTVEDTHPTPADEPIADRLGRTASRWSRPSAQAVADHEDDAADDPPIIDAQHAMRQRKVRRDPAHLLVREPEQVAHQRLPDLAPVSPDGFKRLQKPVRDVRAVNAF